MVWGHSCSNTLDLNYPVPLPFAPYFGEPCLSPSRPLSKYPGPKNYLMKCPEPASRTWRASF